MMNVKCRSKGWELGDILRWLPNPDVIVQITAFGIKEIMVRGSVKNAGDWDTEQTMPGDNGNNWKKIANAPLNDTPPKKEWFVLNGAA